MRQIPERNTESSGRRDKDEKKALQTPHARNAWPPNGLGERRAVGVHAFRIKDVCNWSVRQFVLTTRCPYGERNKERRKRDAQKGKKNLDQPKAIPQERSHQQEDAKRRKCHMQHDKHALIGNQENGANKLVPKRGIGRH